MAAGAQSEDQAGRVVPFGKYLLDALIAEGGMARVYRARLRGALGFEKPLVVKQVRPELARDPRFVAMFVEEAKTLVRLSHPHIVPVYELGVVDGVYFLAMELVDGATLGTLMRDGPLPPTLVARLGEQIAEALHHAHDRFGLVHRDVTPRNVLIDVEGHARLVDFGIATPAEGLAGEVFGSPGYMSPEQLRGESVDARSDLFALGAVLFQALSGRPAFLPDDLRGVDAKAAFAAAKVATLAGRLPALPDDLPEELRGLVRACLAPDRVDRPTSATEVARALRTWLARAAPAGVGAELAARVRETVARQVRPHDDPGPITVTSKKGEERSLATAALLTHALEQRPLERSDGVERTPPVERTAPLEREGAVEREASADHTASGSSDTARPMDGKSDPRRDATEGASLDFEPEESGQESSDVRAAKRAEDSTQPIVREGRRVPSESAVRAEAVDDEAASAVSRLEGDLVPAKVKSSSGRMWVALVSIVAVVAVVLSMLTQRAPEEASSPVSRVIETPPPVEATVPSEMRTPVEPSVPATETPITPRAQPSVARGYVTLHATPWAEVQLDGRSLGTTPVRRTAISAGAHVLVFENPPLGRSLRVPIRVEPGGNVRVIADLSTDEPRARIR